MTRVGSQRHSKKKKKKRTYSVTRYEIEAASFNERVVRSKMLPYFA